MLAAAALILALSAVLAAVSRTAPADAGSGRSAVARELPGSGDDGAET